MTSEERLPHRLASAAFDAGGTLGPLFIYVGLAVALFGQSWQHPFTRAIGRGGDALQFLWFLRWSPFALSHGLNPLLTDYIDAPSGVNLMWNDSLPLPALILSPVTLSLGPVFAYNVLITLGVALSGWTAFLAIRRYVRSGWAASVAGLVYGFSPFVMVHAVDHPHVALAFTPPLFLLILDDLLVRHRHPAWLMGAALGGLAAVQLLMGEELLAATAFVAVVGILLLLALAPPELRTWTAIRAQLRRQATPLLVATGVFVILCAFPLAVQFAGPNRPDGPLQPRNEYVSDLLNIAIPTALQQFAPGWAVGISSHFGGYPTEWGAYIGLPLIGLLSWAATRRWPARLTITVRLATSLFLACTVLSLGLTLHVAGHETLVPAGLLVTPALVLYRTFAARMLVYVVLVSGPAIALLPLIDNLLPARLMLFALLMASLLVALVLDGTPSLGRRTQLLTWMGILLVWVTLLPRVPFPSAAASAPSFFAAPVRDIPLGSMVIVAPFSRAGEGTAMFWQASSGMSFRMPEGYAFVPNHANLADPPPSATLDTLTTLEWGGEPALTPALRSAMVNDLHRWSVAAVVVGPMPYRERVVALYTDLLGRPPREMGGAAVWLL